MGQLLEGIGFKKFEADERKSLEREAKEHIVLASAMRDLLLNDAEQSYAVKISIGNNMLSLNIVSNHKLADFLLNEVEEAQKALNGESNLFE